jgi:hypothetical protein
MKKTATTHDGLEGREPGIFERSLPFLWNRPWDAAPAPVARAAATLTLDHPRRGERILSAEYTFRVESASAVPVEISIDGDSWKSCRSSVGYWWYDWTNYRSGVHQVIVRLRPHGFEKPVSLTVMFRVDLNGAEWRPQ